ncbi:Amino acid transporter [Penicillium ucsense]|uniref:Amino acid transporter n=1 Tax=Penicillium ucsense TaxID=2839758 RepID=A0A8J8W4Q8_9EURO|nr:Amino acid transporter [Penicillium ucsense]KAF7739181.1 Amino acid transporter [Penicillium ucsense]
MQSIAKEKHESEGQYLGRCSHPLPLTAITIYHTSGRHAEACSLEIIGAGWNICNSWSGIAATLAIGITQGGTVTVLYGILVILLMVGSSAATMGELASVYPTAGGQYHWASILAPKRVSRGLSYVCGSLNIMGWIACTAGVAIIPAQQIMAMVLFFDPEFTAHPWHYFLIYQAVNLLFLLNNIFILRRVPWIHNVGFTLSIFSFVVIVITCLAKSTDKQTSRFVWTTFINESGWGSDGIVFLTGLITPNYMFGGLDGVLHLAEECTNAATAVPRALMSTVAIGCISSFVFAVSMLYSLSNFDEVLGTITGFPIYEIWYQATSSSAAATVFLSCFMVSVFFAVNGCQQTASRLTWSFARDDGILFSRYIKAVHPSLLVPVWALLFNAFVVFLMGCIYLASSTSFNALIGSGLVLQQLTFAIPATLLLYRKRSIEFLPASRSFRLGIFGWVANFVTVAFAILVLVFYDFPAVVPVTGGNMNYTSAVLGIMEVFILFNWLLYARKVYHGPRITQGAAEVSS